MFEGRLRAGRKTKTATLPSRAASCARSLLPPALLARLPLQPLHARTLHPASFRYFPHHPCCCSRQRSGGTLALATSAQRNSTALRRRGAPRHRRRRNMGISGAARCCGGRLTISNTTCAPSGMRWRAGRCAMGVGRASSKHAHPLSATCAYARLLAGGGATGATATTLRDAGGALPASILPCNLVRAPALER